MSEKKKRFAGGSSDDGILSEKQVFCLDRITGEY